MVNAHSLRARLQEAANHRCGNESYPHDLIALAVDYTRKQQTTGTRWRIIAERLGVSRTTLRNWVIRADQATPEPKGFAQITVIEESPDNTPLLRTEATLCSPNGFTITGCSLSELAQLLKVLG